MQEPQRPRPLRYHGAEGGSLEAQPDNKYQERVKHEVDDVDTDRDTQRGPGVLIPAEGAVPRGHQQHGRGGDAPDPEIGDGGSRYLLTCAHQADEPWGEDLDHRGSD